MDRRAFGKVILGGMAVTALPASVARAIPSSVASLGSDPMEPDADPVVLRRLLYRARSALDRHRDTIQLRDRVAVADFTVSSRELRFHIVDLHGGSTSAYLVAHGKGSDPEHSGFLQRFSNEVGSLATSDGAYVTGELYDGVHGQSMRLAGLDADNSNAADRAIVIHGAEYVTEDHIATWGKCGRSEGCFAVAPHMLDVVVGLLGPGRLLYADRI